MKKTQCGCFQPYFDVVLLFLILLAERFLRLFVALCHVLTPSTLDISGLSFHFDEETISQPVKITDHTLTSTETSSASGRIFFWLA
jgi:hypothetical protein